MARRWLKAWLLTAVAFGGASLIVPLYLVELGGDAFDLGILFATSSFVGIPGAVVFGGLADRTGKRRIFVLSAIAGTVITMLAIPLLESRLLVILVHAVLWLGFAAALPVLTLLVVAGELETAWTNLIGRLNKFQGVGWAIGLFVGFVVIAVGSIALDPITAHRLFFFICAGSASVGLFFAYRDLPQDPLTELEPSPRRLRRRTRAAATFNVRGAGFPFSGSKFDPRQLHPRRVVTRFTPQLAIYFVAIVFVFTGFGVFFAPLPAYLDGVGYGTSEIFALYFVLNVGAASYYGRAANLVRTYDVLAIQIGGLVIRGGILPAIAVVGAIIDGPFTRLGAAGMLFVFLGLTWAVIAVTAATIVTDLSPASIRGEALGIYGALVALGGGLGGLVGGWLANFGFTITFGLAGIFVLLGAGIVTTLHRRRSHAATTDVM